jgi:hypothetical protein
MSRHKRTQVNSTYIAEVVDDDLELLDPCIDPIIYIPEEPKPALKKKCRKTIKRD